MIYFKNARTKKENYTRKISVDSFISDTDSYMTRN